MSAEEEKGDVTPEETPAAKKPAAKKPALKKRAAKAAAAKADDAKAPVEKKPAAKKAAAKKPARKEPAAPKEPVASEAKKVSECGRRRRGLHLDEPVPARHHDRWSEVALIKARLDVRLAKCVHRGK